MKLQIGEDEIYEYSMLAQTSHGWLFGAVQQPPDGTQLLMPNMGGDGASEETSFFYERVGEKWVMDPDGANVDVKWESFKMTLAMYSCVVRRWGK